MIRRRMTPMGVPVTVHMVVHVVIIVPEIIRRRKFIPTKTSFQHDSTIFEDYHFARSVSTAKPSASSRDVFMLTVSS
jgi:hypothetical protein